MMKDAAKLMKLICDILNGLSEEEISALLEKRARLKVEFPDRQKLSREAVDLDSFFKELDSFEDREQARTLFERHSLRKADLMEIARHYSISVTPKDNNAKIVDRIIEMTVGAKLKHETLLKASLHSAK